MPPVEALFQHPAPDRLPDDPALRRARLLAEAGERLATVLDPDVLADRVARLCVPALATACVVWRREEGVAALAVASVEPSHEQALRHLAAPLIDSALPSVRRALETGRAQSMADDELVHLAEATGGRLRELGPLAGGAILLVPLGARGGVLGTITLLAPRAFTPDEVDLAEALAAHCALHVDNARLVAAAQAARVATEHAESRLRDTTELLRTVVDASPLAIVATDLGGNAFVWNPAAEALFGWTAAEALGRRAPLDAEGDDALARLPMDSALANTEIVRARRDGTSVDVSVSAAPIRERSGAVSGRVVLAADIAQRRRLERERAAHLEEAVRARAEAEAAQLRLSFLAEASAALSRSLDFGATLERLVRLAVPALADYAMVECLDAEGRVEHAAAAHVDARREALLRAALPRGPGRATATAARVARTSQPLLLPDVEGAEPGPLAPRSLLCVPLVAGDLTRGALTLVSTRPGRRYGPDELSLAQQLADRGAGALEHARLYGEARDANRMKDEFLATLSHELRTPLNAMLGWSRLLRSRPFDAASADRALATIERNARQQAQLVEDLLDVSRIITGKLRLDARPLELAPVVDAALDAVRLAAETKGVRLEAALSPGASVNGDPDRLQQVAWNLVANALKFTPAGGRVRVDLASSGSVVELSVEDDGQGIEPEFLPFVFDRFRQEESSTRRQHGGLGLGLAIVRHLVELHGGTVRAMSAGAGRGALFSVLLPAVRAPATFAEPRAAVPRATSLDGVRVLVVDDQEDARELMTMMLAQLGAGITAVGSVGEAMSAFGAGGRFDVLIGDIGLPGEDGYALIRRIRAAEGAAAPVAAIALTAYASVDDRRRALEAGYQVHLAKPLDPADVADAVARLMHRG